MAVEHGRGDIWGVDESSQPTPEYDAEEELLRERSGWFYVVRIFLALASLTFIVQQLWPRSEGSPAAPTHPAGVLENLAQGVEGVTKGFSNLASDSGPTVRRALDNAAATLSFASGQGDARASTPSTPDEPPADDAVLGEVYQAPPETGSGGPAPGRPGGDGTGVPPLPPTRPAPGPGPSPDPSPPPPGTPSPSPSPAPPEPSPSPDQPPAPDPDPPPAPDPDPPPAPDPPASPDPDPPPAPDPPPSPDPSPSGDPQPSPDPSPSSAPPPSPDPSPSNDPQPSPPRGGPSPSPTATPGTGL